MGETFNKKEKEKKRREKKIAKQERKEVRKTNATKGGSLEDMLAYVDEFGNLTSTPTEYKNKRETSLDEIQISVPTLEERERISTKKGKVKYFNRDKGFGFISDPTSGKDIFFHVNSLVHDVDTDDRVTYELIKGKKGNEATNITKL
ncbi:MAG: cold shock domain-containing protein [Chitinophagaceae bacterium]